MASSKSDLPAAFKAKALVELREDEARKRQALQQFHEWLEKQGHIEKCRRGSERSNKCFHSNKMYLIPDDIFLLRFLRVKKYSNAHAFKMFEKFLISCQTYPQWFGNLTLDDARLKELLDCGFIFPLMERDRNGCRVIMIRANKLDTKKFTFSDVLKAINFVVFTLSEEEETVIAGFVYIIDHKNISMDYVSLFSLTDMRNYLKCIQNAIPCRQKLGIFINLPGFAVALTDFAKSLISNKLKERAIFYKDIQKLSNHVDVKILPLEYGGTTPIKDMIENFKTISDKFKDKVKLLDDQKINIECVKDHECQVNSFRKLEID